MLTQDCAQVIEALFKEADLAFADGNNETGSLKLWKATEYALSIVAQSRNLPCQTVCDHFDLLHRLQEETGKYEDPDLVSAYLVAGYHRDNAKYGFMEDYVVRGTRPSVRCLVDELLLLAGHPT